MIPPEHMLIDIEYGSVRISTADINFCEGLKKELNENKKLTLKQINKLETLWDKCGYNREREKK